MIVARIVSVAGGIKDHFERRFPEWVATYVLMQAGIVLLRPGDTFTASPGYDVMRHLASEEAWGWALLSVSLVRFAALVVNGTFRPFRRISPYVRSVTAVMSAFVWDCVALALLLANTMSFGGGVYSGLMVSDFILAVLIAGEAGAAEKAHRDAAGTNT